MIADNTLILRSDPFQQDAGVLVVKGHRTLLAMLHDAGGPDLCPTLRVEIGGYEVPQALWGRVRPKAGTVIHVTRMPAGGSGRKILRTVLLVALTVFSAGVASGAFLGASGGWSALSVFGMSGATLASAISLVGTLLINALIPPPKPPSFGGGEEPGRWNMLTGSSNRANPYGVIPLVLGECKIFPPHAAMPYSETLGDASYQRLLFDLGHGDIDAAHVAATLHIGDTPIANFSDVQYEIVQDDAITLYTGDVDEVAVSAALIELETVVRTTAPNVDEISLDVVFPQGLFGIDKKGRDVRVTAAITVEYRPVGGGGWTAVPVSMPGAPGGTKTRVSGLAGAAINLAGAQIGTLNKKPFAVGASWSVPKGQYEVRIRRGATFWGEAQEGSRIGAATWTVLRSIKREVRPSKTGTTKLAMRIKATDQLNGTLDTLSCIVRQKIKVYDRNTDTWSAPTLNLNPAWVAWWLMTECKALSVHVPASRMDLTAFADFADFCTANGFETRGCLDSATTAAQLLTDVLGCALGSLSQRDGRYGVLFDDGSTLPTMVFTPLDSRNFAAQRVFTQLPHALKVRFRNPGAYWEHDEIIVLDDGYSYRGVDARGVASTDPEPTVFEALELRYVCDATSAWRQGRFHLAQGKYRGTSYGWEIDIANLGCTRGDCVHVAHDVMEWGDGWGRVVTLVAGGPTGAATLTLDERITTETGKSYSVRIRKDDGSSVVVAATPHSVETEVFYLDSMPTGVQYGDVAVVGETTRETTVLLLTGIEASADLGARMKAVAYDARVAPFWANPPATIISEITGTAYRDGPAPPQITVVVSNTDSETRDDARIGQPEVHLHIRRPGHFTPPRMMQ